MPLDPTIAAMLPPPDPGATFTLDAVPTMRAQMRAMADAFSRPSGVQREDVDMAGVAGRLYRPDTQIGETLLVFLHGGGWILGDLDTHDAMIAWIAHESGLAVLAVDYRLAPEHRFPAGLNDCDAAFAWAVAQAASLGCDPTRVAIGGESAGANLAASVTLRRRNRGESMPAFQLLIHPVTDMRLVAPSIDAVAGPGLNRPFMTAARNAYLRSAADIEHDGPSPLLAASHADLSPAIVLTAECDPLRDDGEAYAMALAVAGVETLVQRLPGLPHGFLFLPAEIDAVAAAYRLIGRLVRRYASC